ncbi:MAG: DUF368 domain-containing protein [Bacilli bacterium]|nr:DUF368 domain-containing protein [Bacilli bacterium]
MTVKEWFIDFAKGSSLGIGLLPGVSAGTIGITVGIYDKLIDGVNGLRKNFLQSLITLIPIGLGWVIAGVLLLFLEHKSWDYIPFIIVLLCAGLTVGGLPILIREIKKHALGAKDYVQMGVGFLVATSIGVLSVLAKVYNWFNVEAAFLDPNHNIWIYFVVVLVGVIAMGACIVPGISGAMILFIFGLYQPTLDIFMGDNSILRNPDRLGTGLILTACLLIGIVIGLIGVSKIMRKLLDRHPAGTYNVVFGFVLGSLISMFVNNQIWDFYFVPEINVWWQWLVGGVCSVIAAAVTLFFVRKKIKADEAKALSLE